MYIHKTFTTLFTCALLLAACTDSEEVVKSHCRPSQYLTNMARKSVKISYEQVAMPLMLRLQQGFP